LRQLDEQNRDKETRIKQIGESCEVKLEAGIEAIVEVRAGIEVERGYRLEEGKIENLEVKGDGSMSKIDALNLENSHLMERIRELERKVERNEEAMRVVLCPWQINSK